eukprot:1832404-Rhodomonas_salina.1
MLDYTLPCCAQCNIAMDAGYERNRWNLLIQQYDTAEERYVAALLSEMCHAMGSSNAGNAM